MKWNDHSNLKGQHAILSPSKPSWLKYDEETLVNFSDNLKAIERGTRLHAFAAECILLGQKLPKSRKTLNMYVNDAIGYGMTPEVLLYYDANCFGTADAIYFGEKKLRIHDLKTGISPTHMEQPLIYAALFCLEYKVRPQDIQTELRIYQSDDVLIETPEPEAIQSVMGIITKDSKILWTKSDLF